MTDSHTLPLSAVWRDAGLKAVLLTEPKQLLRRLGIAIPDDVTVKTVASKGAPSDKIETLLQVVLERGPVFAFVFLPSPLHPSAQQAAYGRTVGGSPDDPVFERRFRADAAAALREIGVGPTKADTAAAAE